MTTEELYDKLKINSKNEMQNAEFGIEISGARISETII